MLLDRARNAYAEWKSRPAGFSLAREGIRRARKTRQVELPGDRLRLLTFNIQAGIGSQRYRDYFTGSWKHLIGHQAPGINLNLQFLFPFPEVFQVKQVSSAARNTALRLCPRCTM